MAIKVTLTNKSHPVENISSIKAADDSLVLDRMVYQHLRSLTNSKNINEDYLRGKIPLELRDLYDKFSNLDEDTSEEVLKLDAYLGELGMTEEYFYTKDIIDIPKWVTPTTQEPLRNVVHLDGNTVYNVVAVINSITYNVVHETPIQGII